MAFLKISNRAWLFLAAEAGFLLALFSGYQMQKGQHGVDDFNQFYVGARLVFSGRLYSMPAQLEVQRETVGVERPAVSSSRLPFYYVFLWPLGKMPYWTARAVWFWLMVASAALFIFVFPGRDLAITAAAVVSSLPLFAATMGQRQDVALLLLIVGASLRLRATGKPLAAGIVLSLLAIKIHLFLLLPIALLMRREWKMIAGLATGGTALASISFAAAGTGWVREWLALISAPGVITEAAGKPNLHGVIAGLPHAAAWEAALSVAVVLTVALAGRGAFELAFAAALLGSFLLSNHAYLHDCAILIPALVAIVESNAHRWVRWTAVAMLTPFPYFLPALLLPVREGLGAVVCIAALLTGLATAAASRQAAGRSIPFATRPAAPTI